MAFSKSIFYKIQTFDISNFLKIYIYISYKSILLYYYITILLYHYITILKTGFWSQYETYFTTFYRLQPPFFVVYCFYCFIVFIKNTFWKCHFIASFSLVSPPFLFQYFILILCIFILLLSRKNIYTINIYK